MMRTIIIDDEERNRKTLEVLLHQNFPNLEISAHAENVKSGLDKIQKFDPHLVFLDIQMPDGSGFDLLRKIRQYNFEIIFTTAHDEYALNAFKYSAMGYLLKPISEKELQTAVQKAIQLIQNKSANREDLIKALIENYSNPSGKLNKLAIPDAEGYQVVDKQDIVYLEGERNYTQVILTTGKPLLSSYNLGWFERLLNNEEFLRISKSHIINLTHVSRFTKNDGGSVMMNNNTQIAISQSKKEELRKYFL